MVGAILATARLKARTMQIWAGDMPKNFLSCCAARASLSLTHVQCLPILQGLLRLEPYSAGLRDRIWWGSASNATAAWAAKLGMNLQTSTLKFDETGEPLHIQQAAQIRAFRAAWKQAGHARTPRISVSRSVFALLDDHDRSYFGRGSQEEDQVGFLDENTRAIFGRSYAAEPDILIEQLRKDEAIAEADTLLLTIPNQLGVAYNAHVMEAILTTVAPALGWRQIVAHRTPRNRRCSDPNTEWLRGSLALDTKASSRPAQRFRTSGLSAVLLICSKRAFTESWRFAISGLRA